MSDSNIEKEIILGGIVYIVKGVVNLSITPKDVQPGPEPIPDPEKPKEFGTIKQGGKWTSNPGKAETWKLVNMENPKEKFKFISSFDGLNIIADLESKEQAEAIQNYFKINVFPPKEEEGEPEGGSGGTPVDPQPQPDTTGLEGPYKGKGEKLTMTQRGVTERNYASGKPSDWTIEKNTKNIKFDNVMAVFEITITEMAHDDNLSVKLGGTHMDGGWVDNGISIYEGQTCLGIEPKHPSTKLCVVKGKKYGDIRGKKVKIASTYFRKTNKTEFWVNLTGTWEKACEGTEIGGFKPKNLPTSEVQLRIDGFLKEERPPIIHSFYVQEIAV